MKKYITLTKYSTAVVVIWSVHTSSVYAQATLQNTGSNLQPQSSQAQTSANTQEQVGTLQNNSGTVLSQNVRKPLNVVSNPNQINPDAVVQPSNTLTATTSQSKKSSSKLVYVALGSLVLATIGIYVLRKSKPTTQATVEIPTVRPEPIKVPKKKRKTKTNQKKKRK